MSHEAFQQAIFQEPDDDTHRLVYADWLEDHGEPFWAEFIRVQCELATLTPESERFVDLEERQKELLCQMPKNPLVPQPNLTESQLGFESIDWQPFERGFLCSISLRLQESNRTPELMNRICDRLEEIVPESTLQSFQFSKLVLPQLEVLLKRSLISRCRRLILQPFEDWDLYDGVPHPFADDHVELLADAEMLNDLTELHVHSPISGQGLSALGQARSLNHLHKLSIEPFDVTAQEIARFSRSVVARRLTELWIWGERFTDDQLEALTECEWPHVHTLHLSSNRFGRRGMEALGRSPSFPRLVSLDLSGNSSGGDGLRHLCQQFQSQLRSLTLSGCFLDSEAMQLLSSSSSVSLLHTLRIRSNSLEQDGALALARSSQLRYLRRLELCTRSINGKELLALTPGDGLRNLTSLNLSGNTYEPSLTATEGCAFVKELDLPRIRNLNLNCIPLGARGGKQLAKAPWLDSLRMLDLRWCKLGDKGAEALAEALDPKKIVQLLLQGNELSEKVEKKLQKRFGTQTLSI